MRTRRAHRLGPARVGANMTPMIDVVFLLIIFFLLVAQISRHRSIELELPRLLDAAAAELGDDAVLIVNVAPTDRVDQLGGDYRVGSSSFSADASGLAALSEAIGEAAERQPDLFVLVRAARTEDYARVHPAMRAVADAGVRRVHLVTLEGDGS